MKLFYSSGTCSLAPHIALNELALKFELDKVDFKTKKTQRGSDLDRASPSIQASARSREATRRAATRVARAGLGRAW